MYNSTQEIFKDGIPIATLGSISILTAGFLQNLEFITKQTNLLWNPFPYFVLSGVLLLISCASFLVFYELDWKGELIHFAYDFSILFGLILFFVAGILTLIAFFS